MTLEQNVLNLAVENAKIFNEYRTRFNSFSDLVEKIGIEISDMKRSYHKFDFIARTHVELESIQDTILQMRQNGSLNAYARPSISIENIEKSEPIIIRVGFCDLFFNSKNIFSSLNGQPSLQITGNGNIFHGLVLLSVRGENTEIIRINGNESGLKKAYLISPVLYNDVMIGHGIELKSSIKILT